MSLNIKNEETLRLIRELAQLTGVSQTSAVEDAVRRRLDELNRARPSDGERWLATVLRLADDFRHRLSADDLRAIRGADAKLHDEQGLPG